MENNQRLEEQPHASDSSLKDDQSDESLKSSLDNKSDANYEGNAYFHSVVIFSTKF